MKTMKIKFKFIRGDTELLVLEDGMQITPERYEDREKSEFTFYRDGERWLHLEDGREIHDGD